MKKYVKQVEAQQFLGAITPIKDFIGPENTFTMEDGKGVLVTPTKKWNVYEGDYIVKEYNGVVVFKESRFLKDYSDLGINEPKVKEDNSFMTKVKEGKHMTTEELQGNKDVTSTKSENKN